MNPKDEVKFEDIKKLVNASLEKFYKNDRDLIEMSNEEDMISEQCMVFHIVLFGKLNAAVSIRLKRVFQST